MLVESSSKLKPDQALHSAVDVIAVELLRGETEKVKLQSVALACHTD